MPIGEAPHSAVEVMERGIEILMNALPAEWELHVHGPEELPPSSQLDAVGQLTSPDGHTAWIAFEAKRSVLSRDVGRIQLAIRHEADRHGAHTVVVVARYLSPPVRERLADADLSYIDATGNIRLAISRPGVFIATSGADHDPWRGRGRPRGTLKGDPPAKIVRALLDYDRDWSTRELVQISEASTGATYRVIEYLEEEGLVQRHGSRVAVPDWQRLLRQWSRDYEFVGSSRTTRWLAPRGLERLLQNAAGSDVDYAVTGTIAAAEWAAYAPARAAMIYTSAPQVAAKHWDLRPATSGTNVILAEPISDVVFARTRIAADGYIIAAPSQVAVDLMTGPGRNPSEAEELVEWMARHEFLWREPEGPTG